MSYKSKKESKKNRFLFVARITLKKFFAKKRRKEMLPQTRAVMQALRERARLVRSNNQKIDGWVGEYIESCALYGKPVSLLTQFCITKDLEIRRERQGGVFAPNKNERKLFGTTIPDIISTFGRGGIRVNWVLTFNRSYLDLGRPDAETERLYKNMIMDLALGLVESGQFILLDWEDDVLGARPQPSAEVVEDITRFVKPRALELEVEKHSKWAKEEAKLEQTDKEVYKDVVRKIGCEAEEGGLLSKADSPLGVCLLAPLEYAERYDFFSILAPGFKNRIVPILKPYPWRLKD